MARNSGIATFFRTFCPDSKRQIYKFPNRDNFQDILSRFGCQIDCNSRIETTRAFKWQKTETSTLLERKNRSNKLDGSVLYTTLEPCAPDSRKPPKLGCAERIALARIKEVWIGIEDPAPTVDRKGILNIWSDRVPFRSPQRRDNVRRASTIVDGSDIVVF